MLITEWVESGQILPSGNSVTMIISPTELALVRHLEEQLLEPEVRRSADHVGRLLADEFIEFGSSGAIYDKRGIIDALQFEEPGTTVRMVDFTARPIASDVVLVTYRSIREGTPNSRLRSSIWKSIDGRWQMIFHQGTPSEISS
jgi:hypothetical protein